MVREGEHRGHSRGTPDGHHSTFTRAWLADQRDQAAAGDGRTERDKQLWGSESGLVDGFHAAALRIRAVRFNNRSMTMPVLSAAQTHAFHAAYRRFTAIIADPGLQIWFRLAPGDCLIMDNTRVLHARGPFTDTPQATATRHLQGCYADLDGLSSIVATLGVD